MFLYYPKDKFKNCPKGFNLIPLREDPEQPNTFRAELGLTPFYAYEQDVIRCSHEEAVNTEYCLELKAYILMRHKSNWLLIENADGTTQAGLLPELANRGEEQRLVSNMLNTVTLGEKPGEKAMAVLGYIAE